MGHGLIDAAPCNGAAIEVRQVRRTVLPHHPYTPVGGRGAARHGSDRKSRCGAATSSGVLAIDIGRTGALALLGPSGDLHDLVDMPCLADGPAHRPGINGALLANIIRQWAPASAVVEHVAARPGEAPSGAFSFGRSRGVIEGVLGSQAIPVRFVTPAWWKRRVGIPAGAGLKDMARSKAIARWPQNAELFARAMDHDRAEAALIGLAFIEDLRRTAA